MSKQIKHQAYQDIMIAQKQRVQGITNAIQGVVDAFDKMIKTTNEFILTVDKIQNKEQSNGQEKRQSG